MRSFLFVVILALVVAFPVPQRTAVAKDWLIVRVKKGDTLSGIARKYGVTVAELRRRNRKVLRRTLRVGTRLKVRPKKKKKRKARARKKSRSHKKRIANLTRRSASSKSKRRSRAKASSATRGPWITYRTKRRDTLKRISKRFDVSIRTLKRNNRRVRRVRANRRLKRGMRLRIKKRSTHTLRAAVQLPRKGQGYKRMRPERSWGTPCTIELIQDVYAQFATRNPGSVPGMIADISTREGGWLPPHKSHQRGVDIDVSYYKRGNTRLRGLEVVTPATIDIVKTWELIRLFINTGHVDMIFMDYRLQAVLHKYLREQGYAKNQMAQWLQYPNPRRKRRGLIRHSPGHHHHLHIRFDCINSNDPCRRPRTVLVPEIKSRRNATSPRHEQMLAVEPRDHREQESNRRRSFTTDTIPRAQTVTKATEKRQKSAPGMQSSLPTGSPARSKGRRSLMTTVRRPAAPSPIPSPASVSHDKTTRRRGERAARMSRFGATLL